MQAEQSCKRRLLFYGALLFLFGLLTGLLQPLFANQRMGLAAHLEGLMNGLLLIALGAIWTEIRISQRLGRIAFWAALYGAYANWLVTSLAAALGTASLSPVTAAGFRASPAKEAFVTAGFVSVGVAIIAALLIVLWGLRDWRPKSQR